MYTLAFRLNHYPKNNLLIYYPYKILHWNVNCKRLPFTKPRSEKQTLICNLTKKQTDFFQNQDLSIVPYKKRQTDVVLPVHYDESDVINFSKDFLTNYYIHKRKVWSYPTLDLMNTYSLYIPYFIEKGVKGSKIEHYLIEPISENKDYLKNYPEITKYLLDKGVIT